MQDIEANKGLSGGDKPETPGLAFFAKGDALTDARQARGIDQIDLIHPGIQWHRREQSELSSDPGP
jgi:hypothetical protein